MLVLICGSFFACWKFCVFMVFLKYSSDFCFLILERMREKTGWCLCSKSCGYSEFSLTPLTAANDCLNSDRLGF